MTKIIIEINGGNISLVSASDNVMVTVVDHDNLKCGDKFPEPYPADLLGARIDDYLIQLQEEYAKLLTND